MPLAPGLLAPGHYWLGGQHNFVGGTAEGERNIVAGQVQLSVGSDYNFIAGNYIGTDASGTVVLPNFAWISLEGAEHNVIQGNLISGAGIRLDASANFNWIRVNRITKNSNFGIEVAEAEGNLIVGNSFINNARNASDGGHANRWDDGKEGNYWDDYTGNDADGNGIGDTPYVVAPNGIDHYPLMAPHEIVSIPSTPIGLTIGTTGTSYTYTTGGSTSSLGHSVQYLFDWGDGTNSDGSLWALQVLLSLGPQQVPIQ